MTTQLRTGYSTEECVMFTDSEQFGQWAYAVHDIDDGEDIDEVDQIAYDMGIKLDTWYSESELEDFARALRNTFE